MPSPAPARISSAHRGRPPFLAPSEQLTSGYYKKNLYPKYSVYCGLNEPNCSPGEPIEGFSHNAPHFEGPFRKCVHGHFCNGASLACQVFTNSYYIGTGREGLHKDSGYRQTHTANETYLSRLNPGSDNNHSEAKNQATLASQEFISDVFDDIKSRIAEPRTQDWILSGIAEGFKPLLGPPEAAFVITGSPAEIHTWDDLIFDASNTSDPKYDVSFLEVRWDFDNDGTFDTAWLSEKTISHSFDTAGSHEVLLEVRSKDGATGAKLETFSVTDSYPTTGTWQYNRSVDSLNSTIITPWVNSDYVVALYGNDTTVTFNVGDVLTTEGSHEITEAYFYVQSGIPGVADQYPATAPWNLIVKASITRPGYYELYFSFTAKDPSPLVQESFNVNGAVYHLP